MKYEIKNKKIFIFERKKTIDSRFVWSPIAVFDSYPAMQNSSFKLDYAFWETLKVFKKLFI